MNQAHGLAVRACKLLHQFFERFALGEQLADAIHRILLATLGRRVVLADLVNVAVWHGVGWVIRHRQDVLREHRLHVQPSLLEDRERTLHMIEQRQNADLLVSGKHRPALEDDRQKRGVFIGRGRECLGEDLAGLNAVLGDYDLLDDRSF